MIVKSISSSKLFVWQTGAAPASRRRICACAAGRGRAGSPGRRPPSACAPPAPAAPAVPAQHLIWFQLFPPLPTRCVPSRSSAGGCPHAAEGSLSQSPPEHCEECTASQTAQCSLLTRASCWTAPSCSLEEDTRPTDCSSTETCTQGSSQRTVTGHICLCCHCWAGPVSRLAAAAPGSRCADTPGSDSALNSSAGAAPPPRSAPQCRAAGSEAPAAPAQQDSEKFWSTW